MNIHEQMDAQCAAITAQNSARRALLEYDRAQRIIARDRAEHKARRRLLRTRRASVYRTLFRACSLLCAGLTITAAVHIADGLVWIGFIAGLGAVAAALLGGRFDELARRLQEDRGGS